MIEKYILSDYELKKVRISECRKNSHKKNGIKKYLSRKEITEIIKLYRDTFNWQLAKMFDVSENTILNIRRKYNLNKSSEIINSTRFKPGYIPFNKSKSYSFVNSGQFKPGNLPKNTKPIDTINFRINYKRDEKYFYIKTGWPNKWEPLQRVLWTKVFGEIPPGKIIIFKDKNRLNLNIENLEMIDRKENLRRNINRVKLAESLRQTWRREKIRAKYGLKRETKLIIK